MYGSVYVTIHVCVSIRCACCERCAVCPCGLRVPCTPGCEGVSVGVSPCVTLSPVACTPAWVCSLSWLVQSCGQSVWPVLQGEAPACGPLGCEIRGLSPWPAWLQVLLWSCVRAREARDRAMSRQTQGSGQRAEQEGSRGPGIMSLRAAPKLSPQRSAPTPTGSFAHHSLLFSTCTQEVGSRPSHACFWFGKPVLARARGTCSSREISSTVTL